MNNLSRLFLIFFICSNLANAKSSDYEKRQAKIKFWETAEKVAKVLGLPAAIVFGSLTGCEIISKEDECPGYMVEENNRALTQAQVQELILKCSPKSQGYPQKSLNNPLTDLTHDCNAVLNKFIPWSKPLVGRDVDTLAEKSIKRAFRKGIWGTLFFHRIVPAAYSNGGNQCPTLEQDFFGANTEYDYTYERWVNGNLIKTDILDTMRMMKINVGFPDSDMCTEGRPIMYFDHAKENIGLCRDGAQNLVNNTTLFISSTIIHEIRHSKRIFGNKSDHDYPCNSGSDSGCDKGEFGSYGAEFIFADQVIAGTKLLLDDAGDDLTAKANLLNLASNAVLGVMCTVRTMIYETETYLYRELEATRTCTSRLYEDFLVEYYDFPSSYFE